jgi:hypothetical protein
MQDFQIAADAQRSAPYSALSSTGTPIDLAISSKRLSRV